VGSIPELLRELNPASTWSGAWDSYTPAIRRWIAETDASVVLEVGGGRTPRFSSEDRAALGIDRYLVNDISAAELDLLPAGYERAHFDIQAGPPADADYLGRCDLVFAHMVFEHLADPAAAWRTVSRLLRPGGVAVSFHPLLFSLPFVVNWLLPERLTKPVLERFFPRRNDGDHPKFPARYRWCRGSQRYMEQRLLPIGFASVEVVAYYGNGYFERVPVVRQLERLLSETGARRGWPALASFAYVVATR
jgi:SAM-dependent methyltransferase